MAYTNEPLVSSEYNRLTLWLIAGTWFEHNGHWRQEQKCEVLIEEEKGGDVMIYRSDLIVMNADMTAENALMQMTEKRIAGCLSARKRQTNLVGMVSKTDVLNVQTERQEIAQTLRKSRWSNSKVSGAI